MKDKAKLMEKRNQLLDRLAKETRWITPNDNERLADIAGILAGIQAIDLVIDNDLEAPEPDDGPLGFFVG